MRETLPSIQIRGRVEYVRPRWMEGRYGGVLATVLNFENASRVPQVYEIQLVTLGLGFIFRRKMQIKTGFLLDAPCPTFPVIELDVKYPESYDRMLTPEQLRLAHMFRQGEDMTDPLLWRV